MLSCTKSDVDNVEKIVFWDSYYIGVNDANIPESDWYITQAISRFNDIYPDIQVEYVIVEHSSETIKKFRFHECAFAGGCREHMAPQRITVRKGEIKPSGGTQAEGDEPDLFPRFAHSGLFGRLPGLKPSAGGVHFAVPEAPLFKDKQKLPVSADERENSRIDGAPRCPVDGKGRSGGCCEGDRHGTVSRCAS